MSHIAEWLVQPTSKKRAGAAILPDSVQQDGICCKLSGDKHRSIEESFGNLELGFGENEWCFKVMAWGITKCPTL